MRRFGLALLWLVVTAAATFVAWRAVDAADNDVSEQPVFPVEAVGGCLDVRVGHSTERPHRTTTTNDSRNRPRQAGATDAAPSGSSGTSSSSSSSASSTSSTHRPRAPHRPRPRHPPSTSSTSTSSPSTSTSTTSTSTPDTSPPATTERRTVSVAGGTVVVEASGGAVSLVSAVPNPGYTVEVDERRPRRGAGRIRER